MRFASFLAYAIALAGLASMPAAAQDVKGGDRGLKGQLVTRSVTVPASTPTAVYTTESKGSFVLTQFCFYVDTSSYLSGSVLGPVATTPIGAPFPVCSDYDPGLVFGPDETISCGNAGFATAAICTITGLQVK
jgi:hypothetical protein